MNEMLKEIYLAAGCFWGSEKYFKLIEGVCRTEVGFANGRADLVAPTYEQVYTDSTGYAETVHVVYDPSVVSLDFLLQLYFKAVDPTAVNRQGNDVGTRYRTGIYYTAAADRPTIDRAMRAEACRHSEPLAVEVEPLRCFYPADERHQNYLDKNPSGYCHLSPELFALARGAKMKK